ncbi:MAG: hypothetical protein JXA89_22200 [Anaerolineae bacterium]|nr:hypothetical protein [Anaerolineae bacterium]
MVSPALQQRIAALVPQLTPDVVAARVHTLLRQGQDVGGGVNATRLVEHLLGAALQQETELTWAYNQLKPVLRAALDQIPSLYFFEGD